MYSSLRFAFFALQYILEVPQLVFKQIKKKSQLIFPLKNAKLLKMASIAYAPRNEKTQPAF